MNITIGKTSGRSNLPGFGALLAGLTTAGVLVGIAVWQATESDSKATVAPPPVTTANVERPSITPTYVYLVDSQAQADVLYAANNEAQASFGPDGAFNHNFHVINLGTPEGQEEYRLMNAELTQVSMEDPTSDLNWLRIIDMTSRTGIASAPESTARPVAPKASASMTPTFFYVVDSKEQADKVLQAEFMAQQEAESAGISPVFHHTEIIDVSTLEGQHLFNTVNADLYEMWQSTGDASLIQVIDVRDK